MPASDDIQNVLIDSWVDNGRLKWEKPLEGEREPQYSGRVIVPRLHWLKSMESGFSAVIKGDGPGQQGCDPVFLGGRRFIPDISVIHQSGSRLAIEVKYFDGSAAKLKEALGQAVIYLAGNYDSARVFLVSISGDPHFSRTDLARINSSIEGTRFSVHEISKASSLVGS